MLPSFMTIVRRPRDLLLLVPAGASRVNTTAPDVSSDLHPTRLRSSATSAGTDCAGRDGRAAGSPHDHGLRRCSAPSSTGSTWWSPAPPCVDGCRTGRRTRRGRLPCVVARDAEPDDDRDEHDDARGRRASVDARPGDDRTAPVSVQRVGPRGDGSGGAGAAETAAATAAGSVGRSSARPFATGSFTARASSVGSFPARPDRDGRQVGHPRRSRGRPPGRDAPRRAGVAGRLGQDPHVIRGGIGRGRVGCGRARLLGEMAQRVECSEVTLHRRHVVTAGEVAGNGQRRPDGCDHSQCPHGDHLAIDAAHRHDRFRIAAANGHRPDDKDSRGGSQVPSERWISWKIPR